MSTPNNKTTIPAAFLASSALMMVFGVAEIATGFRHSFFGITTSGSVLFAVVGAMLGAFYVVAGMLILTMKKRAAAVAIFMLLLDVVGRVSLVITGLFPIAPLENLIGIVGGTSVAGLFAVFIGLKWKFFK